MSSGLVFFPLIRLMFQLRRFLVKRSREAEFEVSDLKFEVMRVGVVRTRFTPVRPESFFLFAFDFT